MNNKVVELESLRGIAALIVAVGHYFYAFAPATHWEAMGTATFALFNGGFAVVFFFVLSGYVLSIGLLRRGSFGRIAIATLKRWPRLALPVVIVSAVSGLLSVSGLYYNVPAGDLTGSVWLSSFEYTFGTEPRILDALYEGAYLTFFSISGSNRYNAVLWTMHYEFLGSMLVFGLTALLLLFRQSTVAAIAILSVATAWALWFDARYVSFVVGMSFAVWKVRDQALPRPMPWIAFAAGIAAVIFIAGYDHPYRDYAFLDVWPFSDDSLFVIWHTAGSALILAAALFTTNATWLLRTAAVVKLGQLSFPLYLVHLPVYCSFGSMVALWVIPWAGLTAGAFVTFVLTAPVVYLCALPLARIDQRWTDLLSSITRRPTTVAIQASRGA